jgi:pyruvate/2-oxoglutarate dehydrogenase complex dihydrolipoamide dehydrogenase (E3) component
MEPFAGELVGRALAEAGVDVQIGITVTAVHRPGGTGPVIVTLEDGCEVEADEALFATGRAPLTDDIGPGHRGPGPRVPAGGRRHLHGPRPDRRLAGHRIRVVDVDLGVAVPGAGLYADGYTGRARMVVDEDHGYLLGVTFVGPGVEELIHSATIAVAGQVPISRLWHAVPCFPSISEAWLRLLEGYGPERRVAVDS